MVVRMFRGIKTGFLQTIKDHQRTDGTGEGAGKNGRRGTAMHQQPNRRAEALPQPEARDGAQAHQDGAGQVLHLPQELPAACAQVQELPRDN